MSLSLGPLPRSGGFSAQRGMLDGRATARVAEFRAASTTARADLSAMLASAGIGVTADSVNAVMPPGASRPATEATGQQSTQEHAALVAEMAATLRARFAEAATYGSGAIVPRGLLIDRIG